MSKRIDPRTFVRSALTTGPGVLLASSAGWSAAGVFTLRRFRVDSGQPVVIDQGGPLPA